MPTHIIRVLCICDLKSLSYSSPFFFYTLFLFEDSCLVSRDGGGEMKKLLRRDRDNIIMYLRYVQQNTNASYAATGYNNLFANLFNGGEYILSKEKLSI